jgi:hypothetical protein
MADEDHLFRQLTVQQPRRAESPSRCCLRLDERDRRRRRRPLKRRPEPAADLPLLRWCSRIRHSLRFLNRSINVQPYGASAESWSLMSEADVVPSVEGKGSGGGKDDGRGSERGLKGEVEGRSEGEFEEGFRGRVGGAEDDEG